MSNRFPVVGANQQHCIEFRCFIDITDPNWKRGVIRTVNEVAQQKIAQLEQEITPFPQGRLITLESIRKAREQALEDSMIFGTAGTHVNFETGEITRIDPRVAIAMIHDLEEDQRDEAAEVFAYESL